MAALLLNDTYADSKAAKRLRLRNLVRMQPASAGLGGGGEMDPAMLGHVDWVGELTELSPSLGSALLLREAHNYDEEGLHADQEESRKPTQRRKKRRSSNVGGDVTRRPSLPKARSTNLDSELSLGLQSADLDAGLARAHSGFGQVPDPVLKAVRPTDKRYRLEGGLGTVMDRAVGRSQRMARQASGRNIPPMVEGAVPSALRMRSRTLSSINSGSESDSEIDDEALEVLGSEPWVEAMLMAVAASTSALYDSVRVAAREDSSLVVLIPGQAILQTSTVVLVHGSLLLDPLQPHSQTEHASSSHSPYNSPGIASMAAGGLWVSPFTTPTQPQQTSKVSPDRGQVYSIIPEGAGANAAAGLPRDDLGMTQADSGLVQPGSSSGRVQLTSATTEQTRGPHISILVSGLSQETSLLQEASAIDLDSISIHVNPLAQPDHCNLDSTVRQSPPHQHHQHLHMDGHLHHFGDSECNPLCPMHPEHHHHHHHHPHGLPATDIISLDFGHMSPGSHLTAPLHLLPPMPADSVGPNTNTPPTGPNSTTRTAPVLPDTQAHSTTSLTPGPLHPVSTSSIDVSGDREEQALAGLESARTEEVSVSGAGVTDRHVAGGEIPVAVAGGESGVVPQRVAPSMLIWTSDYFAPDSGSMGPPPPMQLVAGPRGATLLVWGNRVSVVVAE